MPMQADTDRDLARAGARQRESGARLLLVGGILFAIGLLLMTLFEGNLVDYAGVTVATLAALPTLAGLALFLSGLVAGRASQRKPFA